MSGHSFPPADIIDRTAADRDMVERDTDAAPRSKSLARGVVVLVALVAVAGGVTYAMRPAPTANVAAAPPPPAVTVSTPLSRKLATWTGFTGQFSAVDRVELRAQVSGYLTEIHFKDGQIVKKGDLLFVIDPRPYDIALQQAKAQVRQAQASLDLSGKQLSRTAELKRSDFASGETLDQRTQAQLGAVAALDLANAAVRAADLSLDFTRITAPLAGKISSHRVSLGNLVAGGQGSASTMLTTIVSLDPIYLDFDMGEGDYVAYQRYLHAPHPGREVDRGVQISLSDEGGWARRGTLDFLDNELDRGSGTIHARVTVPNGDLFIAPGQFARLRLPTSAPAEVLTVPDLAIATDQSRKLVMTVAPDGTVTPKVVEIGELDGGLRIVKTGLAPNDKVIINGLMRARPGSKVTPQPGVISPTSDQG